MGGIRSHRALRLPREYASPTTHRGPKFVSVLSGIVTVFGKPVCAFPAVIRPSARPRPAATATSIASYRGRGRLMMRVRTSTQHGHTSSALDE
jgi:hypothetical protein